MGARRRPSRVRLAGRAGVVPNCGCGPRPPGGEEDGQGLAQELSGGRPRRGGHRRLRLHRVAVRGERSPVRRPSGLFELRGRDHLPRAGRARSSARRLASGARARAGGSGRDHDAEPPLEPGGDLRGAARGPHRRQHQPALHRARARAPAHRLGGAGHRHRRELRERPRRGDRPHPGRARGPRSHGRRARVGEVGAHQLRGAPGEEDGAPVPPAGCGAVPPRPRRGPGEGPSRLRGRTGRRGVPPVHRRHDRGGQGGDPEPRERGLEPAADFVVGRPAARARGRRSS